MISRNRFTAITVAISIAISSIILIPVLYLVSNAWFVGLAFFAAMAMAVVVGRLGAEIWNTVQDGRTRFIGVYPISFIESNRTRRIVLAISAPIIVLCNAVWYFVPIATNLKDQIFSHGFWEANACALITTWRRQVAPDMLTDAYTNCDCPEHPEDDIFRVN